MLFSLVFVSVPGEKNPRAILCRGDNDKVIMLEIMQRFGFNRAKVGAVAPLTDLPPVGDPSMEALYEALKKDMKVPGSFADLVSQFSGLAVVLGYMMAERHSGPQGGPSDPSDDDAPDGDPDGGTQ